MGIFSRLSDIINANIHAALDKAEDPEKLVRLMIQEMEDTLVEVRTHAAKAIAERKERSRHLELLETQALDWEQKAELALRKDREDLAKSALLQKAAVNEQIGHVRRELEIIGEQLVKLNDDIGQLEAKLKDAKARQRTLLMRYQHAQTGLKVRGQVHSNKLADAIERFDRAERRIDGIEAQAEALDLGRGRDLKREIADLEAEDRIAQELAALKQKLSSSN
ncbi:MAG: phage shock protein PspA [Xanthomonadales bacterium]|jgi:phage shock protein A|nr:phage shock protein PspA [Xanthomonadales bacterium]